MHKTINKIQNNIEDIKTMTQEGINEDDGRRNEINGDKPIHHYK